MTSKPQTIQKDNRHITVTEVASQFAIIIRQVQLTVHHDYEFKKAFANSVFYKNCVKNITSVSGSLHAKSRLIQIHHF